MYRTTAFICALLLLPWSAVAQDLSPPQQVIVSHSGDDRIGGDLAFELREHINSSTQMELVQLSEVQTGVVVSLVTLDPDEGERLEGTSSVYSATWTYLVSDRENMTRIYLSSQVGVAGADRIESIARSIAAETDKQRRRASGEVVDMIMLLDQSQ